MSGFFAVFPLTGSTPNLIFLLSLFFALEEESVDAYFFAFFGGFLLDASSGLMYGTFLVGLIILVFLCQIIFGKIIYYQFQLKYLPLLVIGGEIFIYIWSLIYNGLINLLHWSSIAPVSISFFHGLFANIVYTLVLMYPVYFFTTALRQFILKMDNRAK
jgi:rod shape-determining protein MreD